MYLCFLDINRFKQINDIYGHQIGDDVIKHFARVIKTGLDKYMTSYKMFRWGGDEFVLLLNSKDIQEVSDTLRALHQVVKDSPYKPTSRSPNPDNPIPKQGLPISAACGAASIEDLNTVGLSSESIESLWENYADRLMYFSKYLVKENFIEYGPGIIITVFKNAKECLANIDSARDVIKDSITSYLNDYQQLLLEDFPRKDK